MKINYTLNVFFTFFTLTVFAQTIVSTNPENKKLYWKSLPVFIVFTAQTDIP